MIIQLYDLAKVSNNSQITNAVMRTLNVKLDDKEKKDFLIWLNIVKNKINENENKNKFFR